MRTSSYARLVLFAAALLIRFAPGYTQEIGSLPLPLRAMPLEETVFKPRVWNIPVRQINRIAFSPDGTLVAVGGARSYDELFVGVYAFPSGALRYRIRPRGVFAVRSLEFSSDGRLLAVGTDGMSNSQNPRLGATALFDAQNGEPLWSVRGNVSDVAFDATGKTIATNDDGLIRVRDGYNGRLRRTFLSPEEQNIFNVALSPDGATVGVSTFKAVQLPGGRWVLQQVIALWNVQTGKFLRFVEGGVEPESRLSFSPDGKFLAAKSDRVISIWRTTDWQRVPFRANLPLVSRLWSKSGLRAGAIEISALSSSQVALWDETKGRAVGWLQTNSDLENPTAWTPDGTWLVVASASGNLNRSWLENSSTGAETSVAAQKNPTCPLQFWRADQILAHSARFQALTPLSGPQIALLNFAHFVSQGDWKAASTLIEGAAPPRNARALPLDASFRRLAVEQIGVESVEGRTKAAFSTEIVAKNAPGWIGRIHQRGQKPGDTTRRNVGERVELRRGARGWQIVPPAETSDLPPTLFSYAVARLKRGETPDLRAQSALVPAYSNIETLKRWALGYGNDTTFVSREDWQRLRWGNLRAKIQSFPDTRGAFLDPASPKREGFQINEKLFGLIKARLLRPEATLLLWQGRDGSPVFQHGGRALVVTADGVTRLLSPAQFQMLKHDAS